jgi:hypothetical protein
LVCLLYSTNKKMTLYNIKSYTRETEGISPVKFFYA